ncbi:hypothetical protein DFH28DRAFT_943731 [Melampsora americana]|nr:hypothetical protein DFH28DRAFT_943731 [Melampsora americana]
MSKLKLLSITTTSSHLRPSSLSSRFQTNSSSSSFHQQSFNFSSSSLHQVWVQKKVNVKLRVNHSELGKSGEVIRVKPGHMRQRLYPSGQALYCAKDRIPFHHLNPIHSKKSPPLVPSPGLSRPIIDLIKRLGVRFNLSKEEIKRTEELRERWIAEHNLKDEVKEEGDQKINKSMKKVMRLEIPNGLKENLRSLIDSARSDSEPLLTFKRTGPIDSKSLYGSIKLEEIIESLSLRLNEQFDHQTLKEMIKIQEIYWIKNENEKIKLKLIGIKSMGDYLIKFGLNSSHSSNSSNQLKDEENFNGVIRVIKN